ncbi:MAG: hypothetical protein ABIP44_06930 [Pseudoxanthomonas sp.]
MRAIQNAQPINNTSPLDMQAEMRHWRDSYPTRRLFKSSLQFERYMPTLQFGYDTFVADQAERSEAEHLSLCHHYKDSMAACDRIDWVEAKLIVAATWARLCRAHARSRLAAGGLLKS